LLLRVSKNALPEWDASNLSGLKPGFLAALAARLKRLRKNDCSVRCASLRASLRQRGSVILQALTAQLKLCPSERSCSNRVFPQALKPCPDTSSRPQTFAATGTQPGTAVPHNSRAFPHPRCPKSFSAASEVVS